jgi:hypothetical protein
MDFDFGLSTSSAWPQQENPQRNIRSVNKIKNVLNDLLIRVDEFINILRIIDLELGVNKKEGLPC